MRLAALFLAAGLNSYCLAAPSIGERAFKFLEKNVAGRALKTATKGTLSSDGQDFLVQYESTSKWDKLKRTPEGLTIEETRTIKQSSTLLDKANKPTGAPISTDRVVTFRYSLGERATANSLVGLTQMTANSLEDPTGHGFITMVEMSPDNKELYLYHSTAGFTEASLDGKNTVPVAAATESTFFVDKYGKLQTADTMKFYKVDVNKGFARQELNRFNLSSTETKP